MRTVDELTVFVERGIPDGHEYVRILEKIIMFRNSVKQQMSMLM